MENFLLTSPLELDIKNSKILYSQTNTPLLNERTKSDLNLHYTNGLSNYIKKVRVEVVSNINECKKIWNYFSDNKSLFDTWDFRYEFFKSYNEEPVFLTIKRESSILACLPLSYQRSIKKYTWFGTDWMENNKFFTQSKNYIPLLLYLAPKPLVLEGINFLEVDNVPKFLDFEEDEPDYFLNLRSYTKMEDYLYELAKKARYNLKRDYKKIETMKPAYLMDKKLEDVFFSLINKRMESVGEENYFEIDPGNKKVFKNLLRYKGSKFKVNLLSVLIDDRIAVSDMIVNYNNTVYPLLGGNDVDNFSGIGNFINYFEIEDSIHKGFDKIDYLQISYGWKQRYLDAEKRYKIEIPE